MSLLCKLPLVLLLSATLCTVNGLAQVDQEIFDPVDLLAVESADTFNEVSPPLQLIQDAPPGFGGQRLTSAAASHGKSGSSSEYENVLNPDGSYRFSYRTSDGSYRQESGTPLANGAGHEVAGSYGFVGDDGKEYEVTFEAGENGFVARGEHLPTPPPLPEALQRWADAKAGVAVEKPRTAAAESVVAKRKPKKLIQFKRKLPSSGGRIAFRKIK